MSDDGAPRTGDLDRRRFLTAAGAGALAAVTTAALGPLAGCTGAAAPTSHARRRAGAPGPTTTEVLDPAAWDRLGASLAGRLVRPDSAGYAAATLVYNQRFADVAPAAVAYCASATDVRRCLAFAVDHGVGVTARSGGHSYGGYSTGTGLVIDVSPMNTVTADTASLTAVVGTGAQLIDVYARLGAAGVLLPAGSCPSVGIAGLTLGGGIGVVSRRYGLTCDNLVALDLVTADGRLLTCDAENHEDLFWASRGGGGGNFGIATSFTFCVHPLPTLSLFTVDWPWEAAAEVLGGWLDWTSHSPPQLWSNCQLQAQGTSGLAVRSNGVYVGSVEALGTALAPFLAGTGTPTSRFVSSDPYLHTMLVEAGCEDRSVEACHLETTSAGGTLARSSFGAASGYLAAALPAAGIAAGIEAVTELHGSVPEVGGGIVFDAYGGVINTVSPGATAFVHRNALCAAQVSASWSPAAAPAVVGAAESWIHDTRIALSPYFDGAYQNYVDPTLADWSSAYYGANLPRLVTVKRRYDPDDVFRFAQSIPTRLPA